MPIEAMTANQVARYNAIPCSVVYQETIERRQLATKRAPTRGRVAAVVEGDAVDIRSPVNECRLAEALPL
jgi:hypothetical protein